MAGGGGALVLRQAQDERLGVMGDGSAWDESGPPRSRGWRGEGEGDPTHHHPAVGPCFRRGDEIYFHYPAVSYRIGGGDEEKEGDRPVAPTNERWMELAVI